MSIEKRVLPGMGGGCRERARAGGAAWGGPPAVSPELSVALLMESSREAKGRDGGGGGSWIWDSGLNHFEGAPRDVEFQGRPVRSRRECQHVTL